MFRATAGYKAIVLQWGNPGKGKGGVRNGHRTRARGRGRKGNKNHHHHHQDTTTGLETELSKGSSPWKRSHRVREIQNPVPSGWSGQQVLGLVWHPLGEEGPLRSRKPCKGKGRKSGLRGGSKEQSKLPEAFPRDYERDLQRLLAAA